MNKAGINNVESYSKNQWKNTVDKLCKRMNEDDLLDQIRKYKKLDFEELKRERCELKNYMDSLNLHSARLRFKIRANMTPTIQMNFKSDPAFKANKWSCLGCNNRNLDTQAHVLLCEGYEDLRDNKNFDNDKDLVGYFAAVISSFSLV